MFAANSTPTSPPTDNLRTYGLEKLAPSLIDNMRLCGHKIVAVRSVTDIGLTISTKCIGECYFEHVDSRACLEVTGDGLRLVYANFEHVSSHLAEQIPDCTFIKQPFGELEAHLKAEQYTCKDTSQLDSALKEAEDLYQSEVEATAAQNKAVDEAVAAGVGLDVVDTCFKQIDAGVRRDTMQMLQTKIKF